MFVLTSYRQAFLIFSFSTFVFYSPHISFAQNADGCATYRSTEFNMRFPIDYIESDNVLCLDVAGSYLGYAVVEFRYGEDSVRFNVENYYRSVASKPDSGFAFRTDRGNSTFFFFGPADILHSDEMYRLVFYPESSGNVDMTMNYFFIQSSEIIGRMMFMDTFAMEDGCQFISFSEQEKFDFRMQAEEILRLLVSRNLSSIPDNLEYQLETRTFCYPLAAAWALGNFNALKAALQ